MTPQIFEKSGNFGNLTATPRRAKTYTFGKWKPNGNQMETGSAKAPVPWVNHEIEHHG